MMKAAAFAVLSLVAGATCRLPAAPAEPAAAAAAFNPLPLQLNRWRELRDWQSSRMIETYRASATPDAKWNSHVEQAFTAFADMNARRLSSFTYTQAVLVRNLQAAVRTGCTDPLVLYLYTRYCPPGPDTDATDVVKSLVGAAEDMDRSKYHTIFKIYSGLRPIEAWNDYFARDTNNPPRVPYDSCRKPYGQAWTRLLRILKEGQVPVELAYDACDRFMHTMRRDPTLPQLYGEVKKDLIKNWPDSAHTHLLRGTYYVHYAWQARGGGYAKTVSPENWRLFEERLAEAEKSLEKAWERDPSILRTALDMLYVQRGRNGSREKMELWFQRGMTINSNSVELCREKMIYLDPRYFGTAKEQLEFGRQCLNSTTWGGDVPLAMVSAHENIAFLLPAERRKDYWGDPAVWRDVQAACEKLLLTSTEGTDAARSIYLDNAFRCRRWEEVMQHANRLTSTNYQFFGSRAKFDKLIRAAQDNIAASQKQAP